MRLKSNWLRFWKTEVFAATTYRAFSRAHGCSTLYKEVCKCKFWILDLQSNNAHEPSLIQKFFSKCYSQPFLRDSLAFIKAQFWPSAAISISSDEKVLARKFSPRWKPGKQRIFSFRSVFFLSTRFHHSNAQNKKLIMRKPRERLRDARNISVYHGWNFPKPYMRLKPVNSFYCGKCHSLL